MSGGRSSVTAPAHRAAGFTLLEVLVVVTIIGIVFVGAVVLVPERDRQGAAAERFAARFGLVRERAMLRGETLGLRVWEDGYAFDRLEEDWTWRPASTGPLAPRALPAGVTTRLLVEGEPARPVERSAGRPQVHVLPTGEVTAFELRFLGDSAAAVVRRDGLGRPLEEGGGSP